VPSPYPMYLNPAAPAANPLSTGQKVGIAVSIAAVGAVGFFVGRHMATDNPDATGPQQNP